MKTRQRTAPPPAAWEVHQVFVADPADVDKTATSHEKLNALIPATAAGYQALIDKSQDFESGQKRVNIAWENALSAIGHMITDSPAVINALNQIADKLQVGADWLSKHPELIDQAGQKFLEWFSPNGEVQNSLRDIGLLIEQAANGVRWLAQNGPVIQQATQAARVMVQPGQVAVEMMNRGAQSHATRGASSIVSMAAPAAGSTRILLDGLSPAAAQSIGAAVARALSPTGLAMAEAAYGR